jgi:outer membrane usher protein
MASRFSIWLGALLALGLGSGMATAAPLIAELSLNGSPTGIVAAFDQDGPTLRVDPAQLRLIGLRTPPAAIDPIDGKVSLSKLNGVSYRLDGPTQTLDLTADVAALAPNSLRSPTTEYIGADTASLGAVLNYGVYGVTGARTQTGVSAFAEARVFGPKGVFSQSFTVASAGGFQGAGVRRLDTAYAVDDYDHARRLVVGDFVSSSLPWTPPVRGAGVSLSTDFTLRPDLVTQPIARLQGAATAPSTVELYVDGVRQLSTDTRPGAFSLDTVPTVDGQGQVSLVVTDVLGRQSVQTFAFYTASELLAPGRSAFSFDAGALRENYASQDDRYTDGFVTMAGRKGLNDFLTVEGQLTASGRASSAGLGLVGKAGQAALFSAAFSASGAGGSQIYLSARRETATYSIFASHETRMANYRQLGSDPRDFQLRSSTQAGAAFRGGRWGTISTTYNRIRMDKDDFAISAVNWSRGFGRFNLYANAIDSNAGRNARVFTVGLTAPLDGGRSVAAAASTSRGDARLNAQVYSAPPLPTGYGWRMAAETGVGARDPPQLEGEVRRTTDIGELGLGVAASSSGAAVRAYGSGSLVLMGGGIRAAAQVGDSFAMIDTGQPNVALTLENRPLGRTGPDGRLLAVQLPAGVASQVAIDAASVGLGDTIEVQSRLVRPPRRSGVLVHLPVKRSYDATLQVVAPDGSPIPPGAEVNLNGAAMGRVGFDGFAYLTGLKPQNVIEIENQSGVCRLESPYVPVPQGLPQIGPLVCRLELAPDPSHSLRRADLGAGRLELRSPDGDPGVRGVQGQQQQRLERLRGGQMHLHIFGLRRLRLLYRNSIWWLGFGDQPQTVSRRGHGDIALQSLP